MRAVQVTHPQFEVDPVCRLIDVRKARLILSQDAEMAAYFPDGLGNFDAGDCEGSGHFVSIVLLCVDPPLDSHICVSRLEFQDIFVQCSINLKIAAIMAFPKLLLR